MQIGGISSISSIPPALNPVLAARLAPPAPSPSLNAEADRSATAAQPSHAPTNTAQSAAAATPANSASTVEQLLGVYSATLGGKQYAGTIEEGNGVYTVSVPKIPGPGATASGSSEMAAETNLGTMIDELV
jgi:hypothetical protein